MKYQKKENHFYIQVNKKTLKALKDNQLQKQFRYHLTASLSSIDTISFYELAIIYLNDAKLNIRPTSYNTKSYIFNKHIIPYFKDYKLFEITSLDVRRWHNYLKENESFSKGYEKTIHNQLSSLFNFACRYYNLPKNPAKGLKFGNRYSNIINFWNLSEFQTFISYVKKENETYYLVFSLLFFSGIRVGEMMALSPNDIDSYNMQICINKSYSRFKKTDLIQDAKSVAGNRLIGIPSFIINGLVDFIKKNNIERNERIFKLSRYNLYCYMDKICKIGNIKKIRIHDLRHSHASLLLEMNYSLKVISDRLGHENINTTMRIYSHLYPRTQIRIANDLDKIAGKIM